MSKGFRLRFVFIGLVFGFLIFFSTSFLGSEELSKGSILGFVYGEDGTTPLEGAVVEFKNISTGAVYESSASDDLGVFKIEGVEKGLYVYGIRTAQGDFNSDRAIGVRIRENETAKLSISLTPYDEKVRSAIKDVYKEQKVAGKSLVGSVVNYNQDTRIAEVSIMNGMLRREDRIQAKGENTNFYQDGSLFEVEGSFADNLFAGQTAFMAVKDRVEIGDLIYAVATSGILPLFTSPLGNASVITGSSQIVGNIAALGQGGPPPLPIPPGLPSGFFVDGKPVDWLEEFLLNFCSNYPAPQNHPWCQYYCTEFDNTVGWCK
jgi:hypothetical protein